MTLSSPHNNLKKRGDMSRYGKKRGWGEKDERWGGKTVEDKMEGLHASKIRARKTPES